MKNFNIYQLLGLLFVLSVSLLVLQHGIRLLDNNGKGTSTGFHGPHWHHPGETIESREILDAAVCTASSSWWFLFLT
eukprot:m.48713 g.48713  ORF g.48713 m.48713 type:complete len:77 (+) comp13311_c0_seq1:155-385(+)